MAAVGVIVGSNYANNTTLVPQDGGIVVVSLEEE